MPVQCGVCLPTEATERADVIDCIERVERAELDHLAVGEHVLSAGPTPNALTALSFAAALTERVRLVSAVALAPLYPAALLAKMAVTLDALSGGRLVLGVGAGGEHPAEFAACGVPRHQRGVRTDEAIAVVRALSASSGPVHMRSERFVLDGATLTPPAGREIPIWVAGRSQAAIERAARATAWFPYLLTPQQLAAGVATLRDAAARSRAPVPGVVAYCFVNVGADGDEARSAGTRFLAGRYRIDPGTAARYLIAGDPGECARGLRAMTAAGAGALTVRLACPLDQFPGMLVRLRAEVLPDL